MKELNIDWANMPAWSECWIEDADPQECGGWYKSGERSAGDCWEDDKGLFYYKNSEHPDNFTVHYPPTKQLPEVGSVYRITTEGKYVVVGEIIAYRDNLVVYWDYLNNAPNSVVADQAVFEKVSVSPVNEWLEKVKQFSGFSYDKHQATIIYDALLRGDLDSPSKEV